MISKEKFQTIISKYYLGGLVESTVWEVKDNLLLIKFISPNRDMIGEIKTELNIPNNKIGIFDTTKLNKLVSILNNEFSLNISKFKLYLSDNNNYNIEYSLADLNIFPKVGEVQVNEFDLTIPLTQENILAIKKASDALQVETIFVKSYSNFDNTKFIELMLGDDDSFSDKISYLIKVPIDSPDFNIPFDSSVFKEIISSNRDCFSGNIQLNLEGLMKLNFLSKNKDIESTYFLVRKESN